MKEGVMPLYEHDCDKCIYLGSFECSEERYSEECGVYSGTFSHDLYYCGSQAIGGGTVIARHSSRCDDYSSGLTFGRMRRNDPDNPLGEAYRRAIAQGHYHEPPITWIELVWMRDDLDADLNDWKFRARCEKRAMDEGSTQVDFNCAARVWSEMRRERAQIL